jgi:hypothetical protein
MEVSLYIQLLKYLMGVRGNISRLNYDVLNGTVGRGTSDIRDKCKCKVVWDFGDLMLTSTVDDIFFLH